MLMNEGVLARLNIGIVGLRRGRSFFPAVEADKKARVHALCDLDEKLLAEAGESLPHAEKYTSYEEMLEHSELDAVIIATPMHLHAPQAVMALQSDIHVLSEVTAAVTLEQCHQLVSASQQSKATYMLAENCNYMKPNVLVKALVDHGLFGELYYAEGEYLHELKELNRLTPWRRVWHTGVRGITYGTHSLGPILNWMSGDRIVRVCCEGSGSHYVDWQGQPFHDDTSVMLAKTARGALIKVRLDVISERPSVTCTYQLQGTKGVYESSRYPGEPDHIWLAELCDSKEKWMTLPELEEQFLPPQWREASATARQAGHGGSDYFVVLDFLRTIAGEIPCPIGIHEAMDMTLPGLISQQSIERSGEWLEVPDSRTW